MIGGGDIEINWGRLKSWEGMDGMEKWAGRGLVAEQVEKELVEKLDHDTQQVALTRK